MPPPAMADVPPMVDCLSMAMTFAPASAAAIAAAPPAAPVPITSTSQVRSV